MHQAFCQIIPLDRYNWEACLDIQLLPEQQANIPSALYSIAQSKFENLRPYGIMHHGKMVGMLMYGNFSGICWINRIMIDKEYQRQGIGQAAIKQLLEQLNRDMKCKEIRTSFARINHNAEAFFKDMGFYVIDSELDEEVVAVYRSKY